MRNSKDAYAARQLAELLKSMPPVRRDPLDVAFRLGRMMPSVWKEIPLGELSKWLRERAEMTQRQLADLTGLPHAAIARIEMGRDVRLSTVYQLFAGFGCGLALLPVGG